MKAMPGSFIAPFWNAYKRLFFPLSPAYLFWFRLIVCWFAPILILHQLCMSALYDEGGVTQRVLTSRALIGMGTGFVCSVVAWLSYNVALAWRARS